MMYRNPCPWPSGQPFALSPIRLLLIGLVCLLGAMPLTSRAQGVTNYALSFDGTSQFVNVPTLNAPTGSFTLEVWVTLTRSSEAYRDILVFGGFEPSLNINRYGYLELYNTIVYTGAPLDLRVKTHVAYSWDGARSVLYVNGDGVVTNANAPARSGTGLMIGVDPWQVEFWPGLIDEVRIWDVARSETEIQANMNAGLTGSEGGLAAYWRFDEGSGITASDATGNGHTGTLMGGPAWVDSDVAVSPPSVPLAYTFTTLAGQATLGKADGVGDAAQFLLPQSIALDGAGNIYVGEQGSVRKITVGGVVSTLAGSATEVGGTDGPGKDALFSRLIEGLVFDSAGNLYVADTGSHTIRRITPAGEVSTFAGLIGASGRANGTVNYARFNQPNGLAFDSVGNLYVSEFSNHTIRKITPAGVVSTFAGSFGQRGSGDGTGGGARFNFPQGLAVDSADNLYVADFGNATIRKITPAGVVSTLAGLAGICGSADGVGSNARFCQLDSIAVNGAGDLYVSDTENSTIRKVTSAGEVTTLAGVPRASGSVDGTGSNARFAFPQGVVLNSAGDLYVADTSNQTIRKVTSAGVVSTLAGSLDNRGNGVDGTGSNARFNAPTGTAVDGEGNVYVADSRNQTIRKITVAGVVTTVGGRTGTTGSADGAGDNARFNFPQGIAVDGSGQLYVADSENHTIRKISAAGVVSTLAGLAGARGSDDGINSNARFNNPLGIAVDGSGIVYVADTFNHTIRKITPGGVVSTLAGLVLNPGSADGAGSNARFGFPGGIAVDDEGIVYVADSVNHTIRKITAGGVVSTLAGLALTPGSADGTNQDGRFNEPLGIAVDAAGNLFVAERFNNTIRTITPDGVVGTLAGLPEVPGSADGTGSDARFALPTGIAVDAAGTLYVGDQGNNTIRKGVFTQFEPFNPVVYTEPSKSGTLSVTLEPSEANGQWRFPWEFGWHESGDTVSGLAEGNYPVEFRNVPGWLAIPPAVTVVVTNNSTTAVTSPYFPTSTTVDLNAGGGSLTVSLGINPPAGAGWRFVGNDSPPFFGSGFSTNLSAGTYLIEFSAVAGRVKPPSQTVVVDAGQPTTIFVNYLLADTPAGDFRFPFPVPSGQISDLGSFPFGFNGQLLADGRNGSGVAVDENVVLTAAHLVFNDQTLSYVSQAHWFFRREAGVNEPLPQAARSLFLLDGYAAQRTNDLASVLPDQSTPPSRNQDVAALFFLEPVAGGGHGGYLPSDSVPNIWLAGDARKMLVGYPVDGSQFGDASIVPGRMYQTLPDRRSLSLSVDPVPGQQQQIYEANWFLSYPGNSGGPLYVELNGYFYPAAVYVGTLLSGSQPYASVVRAIDSDVVNLITQAQATGRTGENNTGGGVVTFVPSQGAAAAGPGYLQFQLGPPGAVAAGAAWRLQGDVGYSSAANFTQAVFANQSLAVEFKPVPGWNLPDEQAITVLPGQLTSYVALYTVAGPVMVASREDGIGITGTPGTTYRLERSTTLEPGSWVTVQTITLTNGVNVIVPGPLVGGPAFYRAVLVE